MEWACEGIVLGARLHGESSVILEVMTPEHGRHLGLVRGGRGRRLQPVLQVSNLVQLRWHARLDNHLGTFEVELVRARAARLMESATGVLGAQIVASHLRYLAERDPHRGLYEAAGVVLDHLGSLESAARLLVHFELALLDELGFGLDLSCCAASGAVDDLAYVSPKSARAVSRQAGMPYADRLLALPAFLTRSCDTEPAVEDLRVALSLTGYFLERHVAGPRAVPLAEARSLFLDRLSRHRETAAG